MFSLLRLPARLRVCMGGVRGGDERTWFMLKECAGSRSSSSDEGAAKFGDVRAVNLRCWKKDTSGPAEVVKCCCRRGLMGEDCANW